jgi:tRNA nucleotidyltransferase (CCA-adding enzyme)
MFLREEKLERIAQLRELYKEILARKEAVSLKDLAVKGADLIKAGVQPGPQLGELLQQMLEDVLEEPEHNDKEYLLAKYVNKAAD